MYAKGDVRPYYVRPSLVEHGRGEVGHLERVARIPPDLLQRGRRHPATVTHRVQPAAALKAVDLDLTLGPLIVTKQFPKGQYRS